MSKSTKNIFVSISLVLSFLFINLSLTQELHADAGAELRKKGKQCSNWVKTGDLSYDKAQNCLTTCLRYGHDVEKHPEMLSDAGVLRCNESYSLVKNRVHGTEKPAASNIQAPDTIESIIEDLKKASNEWKIRAENTTAPTEKKQAEACYSTCEIAAKRIASRATKISRAQGYWSQCVTCKTDSTTKNTMPNEKKKTLASSSSKKTQSRLSSMPDVEGIYLAAMQGRLLVRAEGRDDWNTICVEFVRIKGRNSDYARKLKGRDRVRLIGITYNPNEPSGPRGNCLAERVVILEPSQ